MFIHNAMNFRIFILASYVMGKQNKSNMGQGKSWNGV